MNRSGTQLLAVALALAGSGGLQAQETPYVVLLSGGQVEEVQSVRADTDDVIGVAGKVVNEDDRPLARALVYLAGTLHGGATDDRGIFWIPVEEGGDYEIRTRSIGYGGACARLSLEPGIIPVLVIRAFSNRTESPDEPRDPAAPREGTERCPEVEVPPLDDPPTGR